MSNGILRVANREISYDDAKGMLFPELIPQKGNEAVLAEHPHEKVYDPVVFHEALEETSNHRGSWERIQNYEPILEQIEKSKVLRDLWEKYRREFSYAREITFEDTIAAVKGMLQC